MATSINRDVFKSRPSKPEWDNGLPSCVVAHWARLIIMNGSFTVPRVSSRGRCRPGHGRRARGSSARPSPVFGSSPKLRHIEAPCPGDSFLFYTSVAKVRPAACGHWPSPADRVRVEGATDPTPKKTPCRTSGYTACGSSASLSSSDSKASNTWRFVRFVTTSSCVCQRGVAQFAVGCLGQCARVCVCAWHNRNNKLWCIAKT